MLLFCQRNLTKHCSEDTLDSGWRIGRFSEITALRSANGSIDQFGGQVVVSYQILEITPCRGAPGADHCGNLLSTESLRVRLNKNRLDFFQGQGVNPFRVDWFAGGGGLVGMQQAIDSALIQ